MIIYAAQVFKKGRRMNRINFIGVMVALVFYAAAIAVFLFRLSGREKAGYYIGYIFMFLLIPLFYLLIKGPELKRPVLFYIQLLCVMAWILAEIFLDYVFRIDFRHTRWLVISYVILFFAAGGGLIGVASYGGKTWTLISMILFIITGVLAFLQRGLTGL